jgi:hypothetical protein
MDNELKILKMIDLCTGEYVSKSIEILYFLALPQKVTKKSRAENRPRKATLHSGCSPQLVVPPQTLGSHFLHFSLFPCGCFKGPGLYSCFQVKIRLCTLFQG